MKKALALIQSQIDWLLRIEPENRDKYQLNLLREIKEALLLDKQNEPAQWKRADPSKENGEYIPEGELVLMYNENTEEIVTGRMYSSMGYCNLKGVSHWMELPELPKNNINQKTK